MLDLSQITVVCFDGRGLDAGWVRHYENVFRYVNTFFQFKTIKFFTCSDHRFTGVEQVAIPPSSLPQYNAWCQREIGEAFDTDHVMVIQWDGFPLNPELWDPAFLDCDYIGSPWPTAIRWKPTPGLQVGNGGFSLRTRKLYDVLSRYPVSQQNEDTYISCTLRPQLEAAGIRFAPLDVAKRFGVEHMFNRTDGIRKSFGFHGGQPPWLPIIKNRPRYSEYFQ